MTTQIQLINSGGQATFEGYVSPGPLFVRSFAFNFATAGLTAGVQFLQLRANDVIYDIGFAVPVAFNGTTPKADVGTFEGGSAGLFAALSQAVDLSSAGGAFPDNASISASNSSLTWLSGSMISAAASGSAALATAWQLTVNTDCLLSLVVSQDGTQGGTATGSTAGSGVVYVVTSTPG